MMASDDIPGTPAADVLAEDARRRLEGRDLAGFESRFVTVDGLRLHALHHPPRAAGQGPIRTPAVLLPGGVVDSVALSWKPVLPVLEDRETWIVELPGYGLSDEPPWTPSTRRYADLVERFLAAVAPGRALVFGSSMSGGIAMRLALQAPRRVAGLGLAGPYGLQPRMPLHGLAYLAGRTPGLARGMRELLYHAPGVLRLLLPFALGERSRLDLGLLADAYSGLLEPEALQAFQHWLRDEVGPAGVRSNYAGRAADVTCPVLVLHGGRDWMMPVEHVRAAVARMPRGEMHVFPTAGHLVVREAPGACRRLVRTFARAVDAG